MQKMRGSRPKKVKSNKREKKRKLKKRDWLMRRPPRKKLNAKSASPLRSLRPSMKHLKSQRRLLDRKLRNMLNRPSLRRKSIKQLSKLRLMPLKLPRKKRTWKKRES